MDDPDVVDDINTLLKLGVGDQYRLEHIKIAYIEDRTLWESDRKYLMRMKEKYLTKVDAGEGGQEDEDIATIHCWKCGKKNFLKANFCMGCGAPLFDVGAKARAAPQETSAGVDSRGTSRLKILAVVAIPVLALTILGAGYSQGYFDTVLERDGPADDSTAGPAPTTGTGTTGDSRCGTGTVFDPGTRSCVLDD